MEFLKDKYLILKINDRDNNGKTLSNKFTLVSGKCFFAGINSFNHLQVTLDRTPFTLNHVNEIIEISENVLNPYSVWNHKINMGLL